jgi:DNA polymerase-3 subunit epsilon
VFCNLSLDRPLVVLDLETTSTDLHDARIVEISALKLAPDCKPAHPTRRINPGVPIPPEATAIHGIRDEDVAGAPRFERLAPSIQTFLDGCDLCGFNLLKFDLKVLMAEFRRAGLSFELRDRRLLDACRIFHQREPRDLAGALRFYCGREHNRCHSAAADVLATVAVLDGQLERYHDLPRKVGDLYDRQRNPNAIDVEEWLGRRPDGSIELIGGNKHQGRLLSDVAFRDPTYLKWMLRGDFFDDTKAIVAEALYRTWPRMSRTSR